jgi:predicted RNase H-like HicB family nuclease
MKLELTAVFRKVPEGYIAFNEELPGANTQGATLDEARANLEEAALLVLDANRTLSMEELRGKKVIREPLKISVPRHREINEFLARKICRDLDVSDPGE